MRSIFSKVLSKCLISSPLPCYIISKNPNILVSYWLDFYKKSDEILSLLPSNKTNYLIFQLGYHVEKIWRLEEVFKQFKEVEEKLNEKNVQVTFLANSQNEANMLLTKGFTVRVCNQNAFLDETRYKVIDKEKKYDALYLARITPLKRQELASKIDSLRLIGDYFEAEKDYFNLTMKDLHNSKWKRKVWAFNVFKHMAESHTGLCLSSEEGSMFVSTEYLLCGLPVVSTESLGGRDVYYDSEYVKVCSDCPEEIKRAVKMLKDQSPDPHYIRFKTIQKMKDHRQAFIDLIQEVFDKECNQRDFSKEWERVFTHKLGLRTSLPYEIAKKRVLTKSSSLKLIKSLAAA